ncbi:MAG: hypothetical protein JNM07_13915 [Phycisphaerae bacterium]|nr:hypothetical protein [Phycisphaerae bacterium]
MIETEVAAAIAQFGTAGLIGWMWLTERRSAQARESQLGRAHERILEQRSHLEALLRTLRSNTRALSALEKGQRRLAALLERAAAPRGHPRPSGGGYSAGFDG